MIEFHFFGKANKNFRVAGKNQGRSGNRKHTIFFFWPNHDLPDHLNMTEDQSIEHLYKLVKIS